MTTDITAAVRLVLTVEEAADRLGIGRTLMYALITAGEVESVRIGGFAAFPPTRSDAVRRSGSAGGRPTEAAADGEAHDPTARRASTWARTATGTAA